MPPDAVPIFGAFLQDVWRIFDANPPAHPAIAVPVHPLAGQRE